MIKFVETEAAIAVSSGHGRAQQLCEDICHAALARLASGKRGAEVGATFIAEDRAES